MVNESTDFQIELLKLLAARLERLSVDSLWARRASGLRGSVLKALEAIETGNPVSRSQLELLIQSGFEILTKAAREMPVPKQPNR